MRTTLKNSIRLEDNQQLAHLSANSVPKGEKNHIPFSFSQQSNNLGPNAIRDLLRLLERPDVISFAGGIPDPTLFPRNAVRAASECALTQDSIDALQYGATIGTPMLRERLAHLMRSKGIDCNEDNILVTCGSQQALDLAVRVFVNSGDSILVDNPTYLGALQTFKSQNAHVTPFSNLAQKNASPPSKIAMGYCIPDFANPTGLCLPQEQRLDLITQAKANGYVLLEDAAYADLRYEGDDIPSLLALDCHHSGSIEKANTLYCGTFSKTLVPGLRIGWACGPSSIIAKMARMKECSDILSSPLNQQIVSYLLDNIYESHLEKLRTVYSLRRLAMLDALDQFMPSGVQWNSVQGGMFVWLSFPDGLNTDKILTRAVDDAKVAYVPGSHFIPDQSAHHHLRLSFCMNAENTIKEGVQRLSNFITSEFERQT